MFRNKQDIKVDKIGELYEEILFELLKNGIVCNSVVIRNNRLAYKFCWFVKNCECELYRNGKTIYLETKYGETTEIKSTEDVVKVAYLWDSTVSMVFNGENMTNKNKWYKLYVKYNLIN